MTELTEKERKMLEYISETIRKNGYSPSVRDIRSVLGIKSTSTVHLYLERLEKKGYIKKESAKSRTLRLETPDPISDAIPIIGKVTAGQPILAVENYDGYVTFAPSSSYEKSELFALRVTGTSMINAGILEGDVVVVKQQTTAENGDIVVAMIDDEATVKTFYKENGHYRLQPENSDMQPIIVNELYILGKVIASIRYY